ncbi:hypothetical protein N7537_000856 [Penicillium hordei]|uniref:Uncharacterized protein n=1 Tax=Penicillium hordei TaxID=40994 RepID=A0AAD6EEE2_9EURO|nr:uncharacterized protein N7537_000856 [Penicillium hordei]KAJ5615742.1 hypothetical protein N7537_000856 [Penicillium hordei]
MFDQLVLGAVFAGLSSIGIWHSIPLTGVTPSNSFFWRSLSSFEIAYTIHSLRKVHPLVFPDHDAISQYDLLLQLSLDAQQYENARLALQNSAEAVSLHIDNRGVTTTMLDLSAKAMPAPFYLNSSSATELSYQLQQSNSAQSNTLYFTVMAILILIILGIQIMGFGITGNIKQHVEDLQYDYINQMSGIQQQFGFLMSEIRDFRRENEQIRPVFVHLAESITNCSADLQHCMLHLVGLMESKYTSGMIDIESKLDEVSKQHQNLMRNTESFPQIPRQLAWLNILMAKNMSSDLPEGLDPPDLDFSKSPTPEQMDGGYNRNIAGNPNEIPRFKGSPGFKKGKGVQRNGQDQGM